MLELACRLAGLLLRDSGCYPCCYCCCGPCCSTPPLPRPALPCPAPPPAGRAKYGGALMLAAKRVQDAAQGAMVLAGTDTFRQLPLETLRAEVLVMSMGDYVSVWPS